jgi:hypothetical protein
LPVTGLRVAYYKGVGVNYFGTNGPRGSLREMTLEFPDSQRAPIRSRIILGLVVWAFFVGLALWFIYPHRPSDLVGWLILVFAGAPLILFLEIFGETVGARIIKKTVDRRKSSTGRIFSALLLFLVIIGVGILVWTVLQEKADSFVEKMAEFFGRHFCEW